MFLAFPFSIINIAYLVAGYKQKMKKTALTIKTVLHSFRFMPYLLETLAYTDVL